MRFNLILLFFLSIFGAFAQEKTDKKNKRIRLKRIGYKR